MARIGEAWRDWGPKCLIASLAHDKNVKTACHEDKVRGLGAVWRDGHGDRVVPGRDERPKSTLSVANRVWLLPILVLFVLSTVSEHPLRHSSSASSLGVSGVRVPVFWKTPLPALLHLLPRLYVTAYSSVDAVSLGNRNIPELCPAGRIFRWP